MTPSGRQDGGNHGQQLKVLLTRALGKRFANITEVGADWMQANQVRPFILEDPALIWLNCYGTGSFYPDDPPYSLSSFLAVKQRQFRDKWVAEMAPVPCPFARPAMISTRRTAFWQRAS